MENFFSTFTERITIPIQQHEMNSSPSLCIRQIHDIFPVLCVFSTNINFLIPLLENRVLGGTYCKFKTLFKTPFDLCVFYC